MTDYSSWKVADLKAELKRRGIPQTGLRLKQHFIDKLVEEDSKAQQVATSAGEQPEEATAQPEATPASAPQVQEQQPEEKQPEEPQQPETHATRVEPPVPATTTSEPLSNGENFTQITPQDQDGGESAPTEEVQPAQVLTDAQNKAAEEPAEAPKDTNETLREGSISITEKIEPSNFQVSEANTELSTPLPIEEALEDTRKRKRRSRSPIRTPDEFANKKAKPEEDIPRVPLKDDGVPPDVAPQVAQKEEPSAPARDARFRGLFAPSEPTRPLAKDISMEDTDVEPALHPATTTLYIDGLMRPMQPTALRNHLISLASTPGTSPNPGVIQEFFLDAIRTHCFVSFSDVAAASRVRSALHGKIWPPNESNRKNLWADFIPQEQISEWIRIEQASNDRPGPPVRWEVRYEDTQNGKSATLAEAGPNSRSRPAPNPRETGFNRTPPLGPRGSMAQAERRPSNVPPRRASQPGQGFKPLDELFKSTTAKPKLYYLPVPRRVADKRLDRFDELLDKGSIQRRGGDETRRITFEDEDYFVDIGPEYGARALQRRQERGGRGGRHGSRRG